MNRWYDRVKTELKRRGIIYDQVADALGVSKGSVSHYLTGRYEPSIKQLKVLAGMLEMSLSEMVGDDAYFVTSDDEKRIIDALRKLPQSEREAALALIQGLASRAPKRENGKD